MTSDNDLIRRGDAVLAVTAADKDCLGANGAREFIRAMPAATPVLDAAAMQRMAAGEASRYVQMRSDQIATEKAKTAHCVDVAQVMRWEAGRIQASSIADAILALLLPTPADRLAEALRLPEMAALVEAATAARIVLAEHEPHPLPVLGKLLTALRPFTGEARHE